MMMRKGLKSDVVVVAYHVINLFLIRTTADIYQQKQKWLSYISHLYI